MILRSLILENIRSYSREEIEFPRGVTLFVGDIGSGKSTVLMAIEFALFGLGSQKAESLLAKKEDNGSVILEFETGGKEYEIKRSLKRGQKSVSQDPKNSYMKTGMEKELLSPADLKQRVLQVLKFNEPKGARAESRIFRYAIFTPQEEMKSVLGDAKIRLETIRRAFGIEDYAIAAVNAGSVVGEISIKAARIEGKFQRMEELEAENAESKEAVKKTEKEIAVLDEEMAKLNAEKTVISERLKKLREQNDEKVRLESNRDALEKKISDNEKQTESINDMIQRDNISVKELKARMEELEQIKRPTEKTAKQIQNEIQEFQIINNDLIKLLAVASELKKFVDSNAKLSETSMTETEISGMKSRLEGWREKRDKAGESLESLRNEKSRCEAGKQALQKEIVKFKGLETKCPTCEQDIKTDHMNKIRKDRKERLEELDLELEGITNRFLDTQQEHKKASDAVAELESEIPSAEHTASRIEEFVRKSTELKQTRAEITELEAKNTITREWAGCKSSEPAEYLSALKEELTRYENASDKIKGVKKEHERLARQISEYQQSLESLALSIKQGREEIESTRKQLKQLADVSVEIESANKEFNRNGEEIIRVTSSHASAEQRLADKQEKISTNMERIKECKLWKTRHAKLAEYKEWINGFFIPAVSQIEKQVLLSILARFNDTYQRWYAMLVEDSTKESRIDDGFTPIVFQDGYNQEVGFLSSGEKTSIALAYRLTLNSLMRQETESLESNLLILDEPTDGFSKNQLDKIRDLLDELKSQQIVLVSHERELESHADSVFEVSKEAGVSRVKRQG